MLVKELIADLQKQDPDAEVGIGHYRTHYIQKVGKVVLEDRTASVPEGTPVVVITSSDENYVPGDEA